MNIYYDPEKFGLKVVGELEYSSGSYEFDTRVVWMQKDTNKLLTLRDSGCSCPTPFESFGIADAEDITETYAWFLKNEWEEEDDYNRNNVHKQDIDALIEKCAKSINAETTKENK